MQIHQVLTTFSSPKETSLYSIVNDLINESAPLAIHHHNYIVNNIPLDLSVEANGIVVSSVLSKLFTTALRNAKNSVILISAKVYGMVVLVQLKTKGNINPALQEDMGHACQKAQKTGGIIEMIQVEPEQASIAYCFVNMSGQA